MSTQLKNLDSFVKYHEIPVKSVFKSGVYYFLRVDTIIPKEMTARDLARLTDEGLVPSVEFVSAPVESKMQIRIKGSIPISSETVDEIKSARKASRKLSI